MTDDLPAYDANPEALQEVCEVLREGGKDRSELHEEIEDRAEDSINKNTDYGVKLGFLESDDELVKATTRGQKYGYGNLPDEREHQLFRDSIDEYQFYQDLLEVVDGEIQDVNGTPCLVRDGIMREIRINFDFNAGDRVLESAAATFLKTLDAAGYGTYKQGRSGYPTRIELNGAFHDLRNGSTESSEETVEEQENPEPQEEGNVENEDTERSKTEDTDQDTDSEQGVESEPEPTSEQIIRQSNSGGPAINIDIEIQISSEDWDKEEVSALIREIRNIDEPEDSESVTTEFSAEV